MISSSNLFTIGFTKKKAQQFFEILIQAGVRRVIGYTAQQCFSTSRIYQAT